MPFIPVIDTIEVDILYTQYGEKTENVLHVMKATEWSPSDITTLEGKITDWLDAEWQAQLPNSTVVTGIRTTDLTTATSPTQERFYSVPIVGTQTAGEPNNVTFSVAKVIDGRYRGGHGRLYVPGVPGDAHSGNYAIAGWALGVLDALTALRLSIEDDDIPTAALAVVRKQYVDGVAVSAVPFQIRSFKLVDYALDSQRRRLPGRGN